MKRIPDFLSNKRAIILSISARFGASNVRVFGSVLGDDFRPESDVDFLVEMDPSRSLVDRIALSHELEDLLGRRVDVVTENSIYWLLRRRILKQAEPL